MAPDSERQRAWREAVRAFRSALAVLEAPVLFADLRFSEKILDDLSLELPLVRFSPFDALPNELSDAGSEPLDQRARARTSDRVVERDTGRSGTGWSRASRSPRDSKEPPPAMTFQTNESTHQPPAFSFRQAETSGVPAARHSQSVRSDSPGESATRGDYRVSASVPDRDRGRVEARPDPRDTGSTGEAEEPTLNRSIQPESLLSTLAEDALEAVRRREADALVRRTNVSPESAFFGEPTILSRQSGLEAYGSDAMASIDSLAERLLAPRPTESLPEAHDGVGSVPARRGEILAHSPFVSLDSADEYPGPYPANTSGSGPAGEIPDAVSDQDMDAQTYAALVNEALIRQAQRHGVDLS